LKNFVFGKSSQSVSTIANCRVYAQFVNNTLIIISLTSKDDVVTSFVGTQVKIKVVINTPKPADVSEMRSFLGIVNHYAIFLPNLCVKGGEMGMHYVI
jgi:hypothetical protein